MLPKKKKMKKRAGASFKNSQVHSDKLSAYKYDSKPSNLMKTNAATPGRADTELKRMVGGDVFRSASQTVKQSNSNPRRNK